MSRSEHRHTAEAVEIAETLIPSSTVDVVVIDSVTALVPEAARSKERW